MADYQTRNELATANAFAPAIPRPISTATALLTAQTCSSSSATGGEEAAIGYRPEHVRRLPIAGCPMPIAVHSSNIARVEAGRCAGDRAEFRFLRYTRACAKSGNGVIYTHERSTIVADNTSNTEFGTILGPDANFKGDLSFDSAAKILGKFEGSITSKGKILVADGSRCKAKVSAKEVSVEGHIEGNVEAADRVDLRPKGAITGDITAARMTMADGASIDGHCRIGINGQSTTSKPSSASAEVKPSSDAKQQQAQPAKAR
jgi:cytoskeletal protein CcmA (bactofilin family)